MTQRRPRRKPGENRDRLLEAGLIEFGLFGYHGASTSAIAARAEVPQPHVYASFATKRELFLECLSHVVTAAAEGRCDVSHGRLVLQAITAARAEGMQPIVQAVEELRLRLGDASFAALITSAAASLLGRS